MRIQHNLFGPYVRIRTYRPLLYVVKPQNGFTWYNERRQEMEIQLRSEKTGISTVSTVKKALSNAMKDRTIWKISFVLENGERIRLVRSSGMDYFKYEPPL